MYFLFDIGGTNMRAAFSKTGDSVDALLKIATPQNFEDGISALTRMAAEVREAAGGGEITVAAGGIAGPLDPMREMAVGGINIHAWHDKPLRESLAEVLGASVFLENDAAMGALGEANFGAGKGKRIMAYLTIGTGVGGARVVGGQLDPSVAGYEPGWQIVDASAQEKYLWQAISGASVSRKTGKAPYEITDEDFWVDRARITGYAVHNLAVMWSPDIIVLGGSMMKDVGISIDAVRTYARDAMKVFPSIPRIEHAALGDESGIWGALAFLKHKKTPRT